MKYECDECSSNCKVETTCKPKRCVSGSWWRNDMWKEVAEPAPKPLSEAVKLPKLTVEVFDRADCPEWVKYAAVNMDRTAFFFGNVPNRGCSNPRKKYWSYHHSEMMKIPGHFDASDWQNSLIKRPEKKTLPDWCKVGAWVWNESQGRFAQVTAIGQRIQLLDLTEQKGYIDDVDCLKPARVRPWTFEEAKKHVGIVIDRDGDGYIFEVISGVYKEEKNGHSYTLKIGDSYYYPEEHDDQIRNATQLSGEPCGVLTTENEEN